MCRWDALYRYYDRCETEGRGAQHFDAWGKIYQREEAGETCFFEVVSQSVLGIERRIPYQKILSYGEIETDSMRFFVMKFEEYNEVTRF